MTIPNTYPVLDFGLGNTADMLRETVQSFSADRITPRADEIDRSNTFPRDLWPELGKLGLHGITVEEEWGGSGLGYLEHCVAMEEVSRGSAGVGYLTARIPIFASTRSAATAMTIRRSAICPS